MTLSGNPGTSPPLAAGARALPWLALIAVYVLWGSTYTAIQITVHDFPPLLMAGSRYLSAGLLLAACLIRPGGGAFVGVRPGQIRAAVVVGLFLLLGGNGLVSWAELSVPSGLAALVIATVPLWMALIAIRWGGGGSGPGVAGWGGLLLGLGGVAVLASPTTRGHPSLVGTVGLLLAAVLWSIGSIYGRRASLPSSVLATTAIEMTGGGLGLLVAGALSGELSQVHWQLIGGRAIIAFVWLILGGSMLGFTCYAYVLKTLPAAAVATYAYANPAVALLLGFVILGQRLSSGSSLAALLIIAGVALMVSGPALSRRRRRGGAAPSG